MGAEDTSSGADVTEEPDTPETFDEVDEWGRESFPASDPPTGWSGPSDS